MTPPSTHAGSASGRDSASDNDSAGDNPTPAPLRPGVTAGDARRRSLILEGPVSRAVVLIAIPSVATMLLQTANTMLDRFFIGQLGTATLAAVGVSTSLLFALMSAAMAVSVGTSALIGRFIGAGEIDDAEQALRQSLSLTLIASGIVAAVMFLLTEPLLRALGLKGDAVSQGVAYLRVALCGLPFSFLMFVQAGAFRGLGDTVRPLWVTIGSIAVHALFNWLLIFGNLGFPKLGIAGGALAAALSQLMAVALQAYFLRRSVIGNGTRGPWRVDPVWARRILTVGLPAAGQQVLRTGSMLIFQSILAHLAGNAAVAALSVGMTSEMLAFMPGFGYSIAASAFVGQNLGARNRDRARRGARAATWQAMAVMTFMGLIFFAFAEPFARIFARHGAGESALLRAEVDQTIAYASDYLRIALFSEPFLALGMVLTGALQGAGETKSPTYITAITMLLLRIPLGWFLLQAFGVHGAWWAMSISTIVQGLLIAAIFLRGNWLETKV